MAGFTPLWLQSLQLLLSISLNSITQLIQLYKLILLSNVGWPHKGLVYWTESVKECCFLNTTKQKTNRGSQAGSHNALSWDQAILFWNQWIKINYLQLVHNLLEIIGGNFPSDNINHLLTNGLYLTMLSITGLLLLVLSFLGKSNTEQSHQVAISGLNINCSLNQSLSRKKKTK